MRLPDNDEIRILAISAVQENEEVKPVQPLYDVLPSPSAVLDAIAALHVVETICRGSKQSTNRAHSETRLTLWLEFPYLLQALRICQWEDLKTAQFGRWVPATSLRPSQSS